MPSTLSGLEICRALLADEDKRSRRLMFASVIMSLASGLPARVSVQTTDGQYHYLEISTRISTDTENERGGPDKA